MSPATAACSRARLVVTAVAASLWFALVFFVAIPGLLLHATGTPLLPPPRAPLRLGAALALPRAAGLRRGFWLMAHLYVVGREERFLHRRSGSEYDAYFREVPRWLPQRGAARRGPGGRGGEP